MIGERSMKKGRIDVKYIGVHFVFALSALLYYMINQSPLGNMDLQYILYVIGIVLLVHGIKIVRMYFIFAGEDISFGEHMKQYCKCVPVSMILPYKAGDLFKIYCYGNKLDNYFKSTVIVLLDRFVDISALLTISLLIRVMQPYRLTKIECLLILFLTFTVICYQGFSEIYQYWNRLLIRTGKRKRDLIFLEWLDLLEGVYAEISGVCKMRFMILYVLSLAAWAAEIAGLFLCGMFMEKNAAEQISVYLYASLVGGNQLFLQQFMFVGIFILIGFYILMKGKNCIAKYKYKKERNG